MNSNNRYGYLIRWLIGIGDLIVLNSVFFLVYKELGAIYVGAITHSMREVLLLLNFCYFLSLYFVPIQLHYSIVFIDKIVQRAVTLVTTHIFLFATCLIFLNVGDVLATFLLVYYLSTAVIFSLWRVFVRLLLKWYRRKGYNFKKVIIVGAGKNGMDLYHVMKDDLSYGFNILGFFDDNPALAASLPNLLGTTADVEEYALAHGVDEIYCTLPGTNDEKIARLLNFADKHMIRFFIDIHGLDPTLPQEVFDQMTKAFNGKENGYLMNGLDNRDNYYMKRVYLACVRSIDFLTSLPQWDGKNVIAKGGSQGGALALITTALHLKVTACVANHPALSDMPGYKAGRAGGYPHFFRNKGMDTPEKLNTMAYYDVVNFARLIQVPVYMTWGFNDNVCPPTTSYIVYNTLNCPKEALVTPINEHWTSSDTERKLWNWIKNHLK